MNNNMKEKAQEIYSQYVTETYGDDLSKCGTPEDIARFKAWLEKRKQNLNHSVPFQESDLLTREEIHEFGIRIIYDYAKKEGYEILDVEQRIDKLPQLIIRKDGKTFFVMVKSGPADGTHLTYDKDIALQYYRTAEKHGCELLFAGVGLSCIGYGNNLLREKPYNVDFRGFEDVSIIGIEPEQLMAFEKYKRIKWNLDSDKKPKSEVKIRVNNWLLENPNHAITRKIINGEVFNVKDLNTSVSYDIVTDLMTIYFNQVYDE
jgi:hypothetical protein